MFKLNARKTPPAKGICVSILQVLNGNKINGDIGTFTWNGQEGTNFIHQTVAGPGNPTYYQVGQTSQ